MREGSLEVGRRAGRARARRPEAGHPAPPRPLFDSETVELAGETAQIYCDSTYAINCVSKWAAGWERKGWRKADGEIKNLSIIQAAYAVFTQIESKLELIHVRGHVGTEGNELADRMAMYAVESHEPQLRQWNGTMDIKEILRMRRG